MFRRLALATLFAAAVPTAAFAKPLWLGIEFPVNPWDQATRGGFLVVRAYHYSMPATTVITGTAEGSVGGERKSVPLAFEKTSKGGVFVLRNQWGRTGNWVLVITVSQSDAPENIAQALVEVSESGTVTAVQVPTRAERGATIPRRATRAEIEAALNGGKAY